MIPVSIEERIVSYADKFFSKNGLLVETEKSVEEILRSLTRYGSDKAATFQAWMKIFSE